MKGIAYLCHCYKCRKLHSTFHRLQSASLTILAFGLIEIAPKSLPKRVTEMIFDATLLRKGCKWKDNIYLLRLA